MDIKILLGENFKEDMTAEEICTALADVDPTKGYIKKDQFDKTASELATAKKTLAAKMTDDEAKTAADAQVRAELEEKYNLLLTETTTAKHKAKFLGLGYDEALAEQTAAALVSGDTDTVFKNQSVFLANREKAMKAELLKETPRPDAGTPAGSIDFVKEAETAMLAGDTTKAVYYTRMAAEQKKE